MDYFPAFLNFEGKKILIIGGGEVAYRKLNYLLSFTSSLHVIAQEFSPEMQTKLEKQQISFEKRSYRDGDVQGYQMVVVAVDNLNVQKAVYESSRKYNCLCNAVDSTSYCDFIFPSYIQKGDLLIAISTSSASPAMAKQIRIFLEKIIPDSIIPFLEEMKRLRSELPKGKERMQMLNQKAKKFIETW